jgi:hypothetical protein
MQNVKLPIERSKVRQIVDSERFNNIVFIATITELSNQIELLRKELLESE